MYCVVLFIDFNIYVVCLKLFYGGFIFWFIWENWGLGSFIVKLNVNDVIFFFVVIVIFKVILLRRYVKIIWKSWF